jgi:hypothetical protein
LQERARSGITKEDNRDEDQHHRAAEVERDDPVEPCLNVPSGASIASIAGSADHGHVGQRAPMS